MNIHEYQAKQILAKYGVPIAAGFPAFTAEEAEAAAKKLPGPVYVVKSQIHAGGRGKGKFIETPEASGGVRIVKSIEGVKSDAAAMLGNTLVTIQTGDDGNCERLFHRFDLSQITVRTGIVVVKFRMEVKRFGKRLGLELVQLMNSPLLVFDLFFEK